MLKLEAHEVESSFGHDLRLFSEQGWDQLVGRLQRKSARRKKEGKPVPVDRFLPERAWIRAVEALDRLPTEIPPRPARVLRKPQPLLKEGNILFGKKIWRVTEWHGPERVVVEWWMDPKLKGYHRDYFRVVTDMGEQLWIFSVPGRKGFYLHGYFD